MWGFACGKIAGRACMALLACPAAFREQLRPSAASAFRNWGQKRPKCTIVLPADECHCFPTRDFAEAPFVFALPRACSLCFSEPEAVFDRAFRSVLTTFLASASRGKPKSSREGGRVGREVAKSVEMRAQARGQHAGWSVRLGAPRPRRPVRGLLARGLSALGRVREEGAKALAIGVASGIAAPVFFVMSVFRTGTIFLLITWACIFYWDARSLRNKKKQCPLRIWWSAASSLGLRARRNLFRAHLAIGLG